MKYLISIAFVFTCFSWFILGVSIGVLYQEDQQYTEKHYIYKNKCLAIYKGAVLPYDCQDSLLESN